MHQHASEGHQSSIMKMQKTIKKFILNIIFVNFVKDHRVLLDLKLIMNAQHIN